jgi:DME family drug/metabolite transporter
MTREGLVRGQSIGALAAGLTVLGYSAFTVALRRGRDVDMLPAVGLSGILAALLSCVVIDGFAMTGRDLGLTAYLGGVSLAIGLALFTAGSRYLTAVELTLVAMIESVLAPVWVWAVLGERVGMMSLLGGAIVLGSVLIQAIFGAGGGSRRARALAE